MKRAWLYVLLFCTSATVMEAQGSIYQHGTIIRMRMAECLAQRGFMAKLSGDSAPQTGELCPEYTLITEKVVYVIVGKASTQLIPLAETVDFRFQKNELAVRVDDAKQESRFLIKAMVMRSEWEHARDRVQDEMSAWLRRHPHQAIPTDEE